jgi:hypothetical protein
LIEPQVKACGFFFSQMSFAGGQVFAFDVSKLPKKEEAVGQQRQPITKEIQPNFVLPLTCGQEIDRHW